MRKKNNAHIIIFMSLLLLIPAVASYLFYNAVKKPTEITTVNSCDEVSIDSIKTKAVTDTVNFFTKDKKDSESKLSEREALINSQRRAIQELKKDNDSLVIKLQSVRIRYRELKTKVEETQQ